MRFTDEELFPKTIDNYKYESEYLVKLLELNTSNLSAQQKELLKRVEEIERSGEDWDTGQNNLYELYFNQGMIAGMEFAKGLVQTLLDYWDEETPTF